MSQAELAKRASITASHLSLIESGNRQPSVRVLHDIAGALDTPLHLLTLLAADRAEIDKPENAKQISELAAALLRVLVPGEEDRPSQPKLPMKPEKRKKSA